MTHLAEVHTLYESNARSIPDMLRQAASSIEREKDDPEAIPVTAMVAVSLHADGQIMVYDWGETTAIHALGIITAGAQQIGGIILNGGEG